MGNLFETNKLYAVNKPNGYWVNLQMAGEIGWQESVLLNHFHYKIVTLAEVGRPDGNWTSESLSALSRRFNWDEASVIQTINNLTQTGLIEIKKSQEGAGQTSPFLVALNLISIARLNSVRLTPKPGIKSNAQQSPSANLSEGAAQNQKGVLIFDDDPFNDEE